MTTTPEGLEARLDRLEAKLDRLLGAMDRAEFPLQLAEVAENYVAIGGDVFDEWARQQAERGVDVDARLRAAYDTLMVVSEPRVQEAVQRIAANADKLVYLTDVASTAEDYIAIGGDVADEWVRQQMDAGVDIDGRLRAAYSTLLAVSDPKVLGALQEIAALAPKLTFATGLAAVAEDYVAIGGDVADEWARDAMAAGVDLEQMLREAGPVALGAARLLADGTAARSLDVLGSDLVKKVLAATVEAADAPPSKVGLFGAMSAMSDPQVQRALGFLLTFAKRLGASLDTPALVKR